MSINLSNEEYLSLVALARQGATTSDHKRALEAFLKNVDSKNGITRYKLLVQWQEQDSPLPPTTRFPDVWPPEMRATLERTDRAIAKADVEKVLEDRASKPTNVMVTRDMGGVVGWTKLEDYFSA